MDSRNIFETRAIVDNTTIHALTNACAVLFGMMNGTKKKKQIGISAIIKDYHYSLPSSVHHDNITTGIFP